MSREAAFSALFAAVSAAHPWGLAARRLRLWGEVPAALRPALFQLESGPETYQWPTPAAPKRTLEAKLFLYFDARDPLLRARARSTWRSTRSTPRSRRRRPRARPPDARRRGPRLQDHGVPVRDPGDLDGDAIAVVVVRIVLP